VSGDCKNEFYRVGMLMINKFYKIVNKLVEAVSVFFLASMVVLVSIVVIGRYVFNYSPRWGEEIALFCMVWFALLSATLAIFGDNHIKVTVIQHILPKKAVIALNLLVNLLLLGIMGFLIVKGLGLMAVTKNSLMGGSGISFMYLYAAVPISAICMLVATISNIKRR
jgi:TRAP-type C4-dicarboxylate transport system permease small subunit